MLKSLCPLSAATFVQNVGRGFRRNISECLKYQSGLARTNVNMSYSTHMERTEFIQREQAVTSAVVTDIHTESPTVKKLTLLVENPAFSFKAGQWVDFFIQGVSTVGGFSMCSAPKRLKEKRELDLAVKYSNHPPAHWVHTKCKVGDKVIMQGGGTFYYSPAHGNEKNDILLIAGGVGINPLFSILKHVQDLKHESALKGEFTPRTKLLFSAKQLTELLFKNEIDQIVKEDVNVSCSYHITGEDESVCNDGTILPYRISQNDISSSLAKLGGPERTSCYVCGPPPMIEVVHATLVSCGVPENAIHFEKWW